MSDGQNTDPGEGDEEYSYSGSDTDTSGISSDEDAWQSGDGASYGSSESDAESQNLVRPGTSN